MEKLQAFCSLFFLFAKQKTRDSNSICFTKIVNGIEGNVKIKSGMMLLCLIANGMCHDLSFFNAPIVQASLYKQQIQGQRSILIAM